MKDEDIIKDDLVGKGPVDLDELAVDTEITKMLKVNEVGTSEWRIATATRIL